MTKGKIKAIVSNLLEIEFYGAVMQNEICYVKLGEKSLMAEVIKITGKRAFAQLFERSTSLKLNDDVEFSGELLEVDLGPGILSKNFDGLQNDLEAMSGTFIETGQKNVTIDLNAVYTFTPLAKKKELW
jgi:V/A-type H+-transporting ATPase subunit A